MLSRRQVVQTTRWAIAILLTLCGGPCLAEPPSRPNVVIIYTDDK